MEKFIFHPVLSFFFYQTSLRINSLGVCTSPI